MNRYGLDSWRVYCYLSKVIGKREKINMKRPIILTLAILAVSIASCRKTAPDGGPAKDRIPIRIATSLTKVTDDAFETGDKVGIYIVNQPLQLKSKGNHIDNARFTFSGSEWKSAQEIYWLDNETRADFYCYFPHREKTVNALQPIQSNALQDQSSEAGYKASDYLWGKAEGISPTSNPVVLTLRHIMSCIQVSLKAGTGWSPEELKNAQVSLHGLMTSASFSLKDGSISANGGRNTVLPFKTSDGNFRVLIPPQKVEDSELITIKLGHKEYKHKTSVSLESGKIHRCSIVVNRIGEGIYIGVDPWEDAGEDFGGSVE